MGGPDASPAQARSFQSHDELIAFAQQALHEDRKVECAHAVARFAGNPVRSINEKQADQINFSLLQWCLDNDRYYDAASLLWPEALFTAKPRSTRQVWEMWETSSSFLIQGAASMSKSFAIGVRLLLEWVRDPQYTTIRVLGPSEDHLQNNLFSHLVELHNNASIKLPGTVQSLFIGLDARSRRGSIAGVIVPLGKKSAAKLQGSKRFPRRKPHPQFGNLSRMFIFMDEMNKIPPGIWSDVDNVLANSKGGDIPGFKIGGAYNPQDQTDQVGIRAEPEWGWESFDMDTHFKWKSKRGWDVLRLDALKCENVIEGREIYSGLQTKEGMEKIIRNSGGYDTPGYYSMVRGAYPPAGKKFSIIAQGMLNRAKAEVLWASSTRPVGGADVALEGGDNAVIATGQWGLARGLKFPPSIEHPEGEEVLFRRQGKPTFKHILQIENLYTFPKGDTVVMANQIKSLCQKLGIRPEWLCVDRTGNGSGVHDHLKTYWNPAVKGLNFYQGASEKKIMVEDEKVPKDEYLRAVSEVWFSMQKFLEFEYMKFSPSLDTEKLNPQMGGRMFSPGKLSKVESKKEYCARGNESPNEADAVGLCVYAVRMETDVGLTMSPEPGETGDEGDDDGNFLYVDCTNRIDYL